MAESRSLALPAALVLAAGVAAAGWFVGGGIRYFKNAERYVSVKGLAEREVPADLAIWPIVFSVSGNDLSELQLRLEGDARKVAGYLAGQGFDAEQYALSAPRVTDNAPQGGVDGRAPQERYQVEATVILRTPAVAEARRAMERSGALVKEGVRLLRSWEYNTQYFFTDLDRIKPEMIAEATADARRAAEKFAQDSGASVGGIRRAQQGYFSIEDRDPFSPETKKIRVVTSVDYFLVGACLRAAALYVAGVGGGAARARGSVPAGPRRRNKMLLDIHGLVLVCESSSPAVERALVRPFRTFVVSGESAPAPRIRVAAELIDPPYASFPPLAARFSTPRNVVYEHDQTKIVDYFGRGVAERDAARTGFRLWSRDENLLREIFYLLVLSLLGEHCDRSGLLRVHALAVSHRDRAFLFLMPSGSGKSTLALGLMETGRFGYISDDDPLYHPVRGILPFPRALGTLDRQRLAHVPDSFVARVDRMEFGTKYQLDSDWWGERVERRALADVVLVVTRRVLNGEPAIEPVPRAVARRALVRDAVLGLGLYQGLEFLVQRSTVELAAKLPALLRRWRLARRLAASARTYRLTANRDPAAVRRTVESFVEALP